MRLTRSLSPYALSSTSWQAQLPTVRTLVRHQRLHSFAWRKRSAPINRGPWLPWWKQYPDWPASRQSVEATRLFILQCLASRSPTLLVVDPGRDGLASGQILQQTLLALGKPKNKIGVHFLQKRSDVRESSERQRLERATVGGEQPGAIIILAQGSHDKIVPGIPTLILDHNRPSAASRHAVICSACEDPTVSKSVVLAYVVCERLLRSLNTWSATLDDALTWLFRFGLTGPDDFRGPAIENMIRMKWKQFAKVEELFISYTRMSISLLHKILAIFWFTPEFNPQDCWMLMSAVLEAISVAGRNGQHPPEMDHLTLQLIINDYLLPKIRETELELKKWRKIVDAQPRFSHDGKIAVITIQSPYEVHPFLAPIWARLLGDKAELTAVICANIGYIPGKIDFSCCLAETYVLLSGTAYDIDHTTHTRTRSILSGFTYTQKLHRSKKGWPVVLSPSQIELQASLERYAERDSVFLAELAEAENKGEASFAATHRHMIGPGGHYIGGTLSGQLWEMFTTKCLGLPLTVGWENLDREVVMKQGRRAIDSMLYGPTDRGLKLPYRYKGWFLHEAHEK
ncbi:hypothetical protein ABW21_db0209501 [Orbilia brochopaga]|nr:hypothetical protein ABW21_db0209501 [Drechslerella brochopaga]